MITRKPVIGLLGSISLLRRTLEQFLADEGLAVVDYPASGNLLAEMAAHPVDVLVLDLHAGLNGFEVLASFKTQHITIPVIAVTDHDTSGTRKRVLALGAAAYLVKPLDVFALINVIRVVCGSSGDPGTAVVETS